MTVGWESGDHGPMTGEPPTGRRSRRVITAALSWLATAELAAAIGCALAAGTSFAEATSSFTVTNGAMGLACTACGALLAWNRPKNPIGWLLLAAGVAQATSTASGALLALAGVDGWSLGALRLLGTLAAYPWTFSIGMFVPLALLLFPDGQPAGRRWRWLLWASVIDGALFVASFASPTPLAIDGLRVTPYLTIGGYARLAPLWVATEIGWAVIFGSAITSLAVRYRRGDDTLRRQLLWLVLAGLAALAFTVPWGVFGTGPVLGLLVIPLIPVAITIAILRHRLLDIRLVVSRALLYGLLTALCVGSYVGLVASLDAVVDTRVSLFSAVVASLIVAIAFNPARVWLQRVVNRALYGDRGDAVRAVSRIGERMTGSGARLSGVLEALCESLRLPYAAVRYGPLETAAYGSPPELRHSVDLSYDGALIGELVVGLRAGQGRLSAGDVAVLELLAAPLAVALHATALSAAVQESRLSIVAAREEERRRLRRDLHDGLGPALTGIAFKADAARNTLAREPERADQLLAEMRTGITTAIADIRRLVYALRPPSLDDLGLVGSLREQSRQLAERGEGASVHIRLDVPGDLPPLPAAVEVAAYRIITEAMTNAVRHSAATTIAISLALAEKTGLTIEVTDDGKTRTGEWQPGVGLASMRERAAELGGSCHAGPDPAGGGRVAVSLPLAGTTGLGRPATSSPRYRDDPAGLPVLSAGAAAFPDPAASASAEPL
jgi:two-component system, NarL family, sensor kinase